MLLVSGYRNMEGVSVQSDHLTGVRHKSYKTCRKKHKKMCVCALTHFANSHASVGDASVTDKSPGAPKGSVCFQRTALEASLHSVLVPMLQQSS